MAWALFHLACRCLLTAGTIAVVMVLLGCKKPCVASLWRGNLSWRVAPSKPQLKGAARPTLITYQSRQLPVRVILKVEGMCGVFDVDFILGLLVPLGCHAVAIQAGVQYRVFLLVMVKINYNS